MSYHILQQFDGPWLAETKQTDEVRPDSVFNPVFPERETKTGAHARPVLWLVIIASLLFAASSLLFALDARRRADNFEKRLTTLERQK